VQSPQAFFNAPAHDPLNHQSLLFYQVRGPQDIRGSKFRVLSIRPIQSSRVRRLPFFNPCPFPFMDDPCPSLTWLYTPLSVHVVQVLMPGWDAWGCSPCCGTNVLFRRQALLTVGGFSYGSITEDFLTSCNLAAKYVLGRSAWRDRSLRGVGAVVVVPVARRG
jgi:hypothetical protein